MVLSANKRWEIIGTLVTKGKDRNGRTLYGLTEESREPFKVKQEKVWRDGVPLANTSARNAVTRGDPLTRKEEVNLMHFIMRSTHL